jgi:hypothetical protein
MEIKRLSAVETALLPIAIEASSQPIMTASDRDSLLTHVTDADFANRHRVHDWRNHVEEEIVDNWHLLSLETKLAVFIKAARDAGNEEWE